MLLRIEYTQADRVGNADFMGDAKAMMDGSLRLFTTEQDGEDLKATLEGALISSICMFDPESDELSHTFLSSLREETGQDEFENTVKYIFQPALDARKIVYTSPAKQSSRELPKKRVRARREHTSSTSRVW